MTTKNIWSHFEKLGNLPGYKQRRARCKYCDYELYDSSGRCEGHLKRCKLAPVQVLQSFFDTNNNNNNSNNNSNESSSLSSPSSSSTIITTNSRVIHQSINNFLDRISKTEQELELMFAKSIYQCGLFLSLPELKPIQDLWRKARPAFKLPGRKKLSTTLLNKVYEETRLEVNDLINNAEYVCLISDGW